MHSSKTGQFVVVATFSVALLTGCGDDDITGPSGNNGSSTRTTTCSPGALEFCADTTYIDTVDSSVYEVMSWDPERRELRELLVERQWYVGGESFVHHYDARLRDSIVYWVEGGSVEDPLAYSGWGEYIYSEDGWLKEIKNYNAWDSLQYGYRRYDSSGNEIAWMVDEQVNEYDGDGNITKSYWEGLEDTTIYFYDETGEQIERRNVRGDVTVQRVRNGSFEWGANVFQEDFDSQGRLEKETYYLDWLRLREIYYLPDGSVEKKTIYTRWSAENSVLKEMRTLDGEGNIIEVLYYNDKGRITSQQIGDSAEVQCLEPLSTWQCKTPESQ